MHYLKNMINFFINNSYQIILSVIGGLITVALIKISQFLCRKYQYRKFKMIFGSDIIYSRNFHLIYAQLVLPVVYNEKNEIVRYPYVKPSQPGIRLSISMPVSGCELRAAKYLSDAIGRQAVSPPILSSDHELKDHLNISFISFGGPFSNYKTNDANLNEGNDLVKFDQTNQQFVSVKSKRNLFNHEQGFDYGLILKIHPKQFPKRTWIICAGIGEWGTSSAAWYLAKNWKMIYAFAKNRPFAYIIKVKNEQDESAELIAKACTQEDLEKQADTVQKNKNC
jgi:hypothetical protein